MQQSCVYKSLIRLFYESQKLTQEVGEIITHYVFKGCFKDVIQYVISIDRYFLEHEE